MTDWTDLAPNAPSAVCLSVCVFVLYVCVRVWSRVRSKDLSGALEAALECQKLYSHLPRIHDIIVALMEKGDTELLQRGDLK